MDVAGTVDDYPYCPCRWRSELYNENPALVVLTRLASRYRNGDHLPRSGGSGEQPAGLMRCIEIIDAECRRVEKWQMDEAKKTHAHG